MQTLAIYNQSGLSQEFCTATVSTYCEVHLCTLSLPASSELTNEWRIVKFTINIQGVQPRMISVVNFFVCFLDFVVAICDLVHAVEAMYDLT